MGSNVEPAFDGTADRTSDCRAYDSKSDGDAVARTVNGDAYYHTQRVTDDESRADVEFHDALANVVSSNAGTVAFADTNPGPIADALSVVAPDVGAIGASRAGAVVHTVDNANCAPFNVAHNRLPR